MTPRVFLNRSSASRHSSSSCSKRMLKDEEWSSACFAFFLCSSTAIMHADMHLFEMFGTAYIGEQILIKCTILVHEGNSRICLPRLCHHSSLPLSVQNTSFFIFYPDLTEEGVTQSNLGASDVRKCSRHQLCGAKSARQRNRGSLDSSKP